VNDRERVPRMLSGEYAQGYRRMRTRVLLCSESMYNRCIFNIELHVYKL